MFQNDIIPSMVNTVKVPQYDIFRLRYSGMWSSVLW